jgi:hypothetical protein
MDEDGGERRDSKGMRRRGGRRDGGGMGMGDRISNERTHL